MSGIERWQDAPGAEGVCIGGGAHQWRPEWLARDTWHDGDEWRTCCERCGLRRARIEDASDAVCGLHFLSGADAWPDVPDDEAGSGS